MLSPAELRINNGRLTNETIVPNKEITLSWALGGEGKQCEYAVCLYGQGEKIFDSGWVKSTEQSCVVTSPLMRSGFE